MRLMDCEYARPVLTLPAELAKKLEAVGPGGLEDREGEVYRSVLGMLPGWPEAFATKAARDAALGPYGPYANFVPTTFAEVQNAGFTASGIAIGHPLGDPDFETVAPAVLKAMAERVADDGHATVIIGRVRYEIGSFRDDVGVSALPEFDARGEPTVINKTMRWLNDNYAHLVRKQLAAQA